MSSTTQRPEVTDGGLIDTVRQAFVEISDGYSQDRVIADPDLNNTFLALCAKLGCNHSPTELNRSLLNLRKSGRANIRTTRRTSIRDADRFRHASEVAIRFLERHYNTSLDDILCDPVKATHFDEIAGRIAPGYRPLQYRWAALQLRKTNGLKPELMSHVVRPVAVHLGFVGNISSHQLSSGQGLYVFYSSDQTLYVGEASNLRLRLSKHLDHSDNKELARWFWEHGFDKVALEIHELPSSTRKKVRRALESELIRSRNPIFNVQRY